jgi:peroxiredoxin Q/BCP
MGEGDTAPDFTLPDQDGTERDLRDLLATGPVALFFFPAAFTGGCTVENRRFRDLAPDFAAVGAGRVGISPDPVSRLAAFARAHALGFPVLSDVDGTVARAFGLVRRFGPLRRQTFVVDTDRRVLAVIRSEFRMEAHADGALAALRARTDVG